MSAYDFLNKMTIQQELVIDRAPLSPLPDWQFLPGTDADAMAIQILRVDQAGLSRNVIAYAHVGLKTGPDYYPITLAETRTEVVTEMFIFYQRPEIISPEFQASYATPLLLVPQVWLAPQFMQGYLRFYAGSL